MEAYTAHKIVGEKVRVSHNGPGWPAKPGPVAVLCLAPGWQEPVVRRLLRCVNLSRLGRAAGELSPGQVLPGSFPGGPLLAETTFVLVRSSSPVCRRDRCWLLLPWRGPPVGLVVPGARGGLGVFELTLALVVAIV